MADIQASILGDAPTNYAGDVSVDEAWRVLQQDEKSILIDVRTKAEWAFVGTPDISAAGKELVRVEWQTYPSMELNADFLQSVRKIVEERGASVDTNLFVICRSGARSTAAAIALSEAGFQVVHNVAGGFEGDLDGDRRRGRSNGWKASGLPWGQN
jgi:rhodanese-related sulfurtransferase